MKLGLDNIANYKNKLSIINLCFCVFLILTGSVDSVASMKSFIGASFATLSPLLWNQWLYGELFGANSTHPFISLKAFLWVGFIISVLISVFLILGLLRGTL